ncbi:hypothetical protein PPERSA_11914 [Pseudocohnilembus persalinus]|uniref:Metal-dependent protein hydrolase n=1 Tax=Pseudocohnilembus persalinus TaxID=266149 RepID=A0A0V0QJY2_PSEPJ|nr:hypothetical protein PPERSA_11914 [Pseudocohnilembus persalinus]|eukprot:KRX02574.1 hypothetical protein PPERSA_11914 [Pseudocohnilembus persalinus]
MEQENIKKIGTHSGCFHADEVLACVMLTKYTKDYKDAEIIRTRDSQILDQMDLVVDVGGVYEPERHRYDHHQKSFTGTLEYDKYDKTKLSGAGLIYKHFGKEVIQNVINEILSDVKLKIKLDTKDPQLLEQIYKKVYGSFLEAVDGIDNGVNQYSTDLKPNYRETTNYGARIGRLNTTWSVEGEEEDVQFKKAMPIAQEELVWQVRNALLKWYPARPIVLEALKNRFNVHESGAIIKLDQSVPVDSHLYDLEEELNIKGQIKFVLFPEGVNSKAWRVKAINLENSFELRNPLKKEWRGIKDIQQLKEISKIDDIVFVHVSGFIGGARSYESAFKMATLSLEEQKEEKQQ